MAEKRKAPAAPAKKKSDELLEQLANLDLGTTATLSPTVGPGEQYYTDPRYNVAAPPGYQPWRDIDTWGPGAFSAEEKAAIQQRLAAVGLYENKTYRPGIWAAEDASAFSRVLEFANAQFIADPYEALNAYERTVSTQSPRTAGPRAPLVTQYANPESVRMVVRDSSYKMLGRRLSDDEEARIVQAYQGQYAGSQAAEYAAGATGGGFTAPMAPADFAESQIERQFGTEVGVQKGIDAFGEIVKNFGTIAEKPRLTAEGGIA